MWELSRAPTKDEVERYNIDPEDMRPMLILAVARDGHACVADASDAKLIIKAVNNHAALVDALRDTLAIARIKWGNLDPDANRVMDAARNAIAKLELP